MLEFSVVAVILASILSVHFWRKYREKQPKVAVAAKAASAPSPATSGVGAKQAPTHGFGEVFLDALTYPTMWVVIIVIAGVAWWFELPLTPSLVWIPLVLWVLYLFVARARMASKIKNGGREKAAYPGLTAATTLLGRLAFIATLAVVAYYGVFAPAGTWEKLTGQNARPPTFSGPKDPMIQKGVPREPHLTSKDLGENWTVEYVMSNPQYVVPQGAWNGKRLTIVPKPKREVTDAANLTISFGEAFEELDIELRGPPGSCGYVAHKRASKSCVGDWKDRSGKISGYYYLEINTWGTAFTAYLYGPNEFPRRESLGIISSPPIPKAMLRFRQKR